MENRSEDRLRSTYPKPTLWRLIILWLLVVIAFLSIWLGPFSEAHAQNQFVTPMGQVLCRIVGWIIYGNFGRGLATLAVVVVGVGALLGKASWGMAITVAIGISVMFGAPEISSMLGATPFCDY